MSKFKQPQQFASKSFSKRSLAPLLQICASKIASSGQIRPLQSRRLKPPFPSSLRLHTLRWIQCVPCQYSCTGWGVRYKTEQLISWERRATICFENYAKAAIPDQELLLLVIQAAC